MTALLPLSGSSLAWLPETDENAYWISQVIFSRSSA